MTAINLYALAFKADATELHWFPMMLATASSDIYYDLCSAFPVEVEYRRRAVTTPDGSGFAAGSTIWKQGDLRTFHLRFPMANIADAARVRQLWRDARGRVLPMVYTPPGEDELLVRFGMDTLVMTRVSAVTYSFDVRLDEVR